MICAFTNNSSCLQGLLFVFRGRSLCRICKLVQRTVRRTFPRATLAGQPLRHFVPPPLAQGRLGDFAVCHLPLHRGGWEILQCATSAYIREGSRFCKIIPLEDTPHGSLVPREQSAGTADGGIDGLVQHIKRTTQRLLGGSFLFSCKNQRTTLIKPVWPWLKNLPLASFRSAAALRSLYFVHNRLDWCDQSPQSVLPIVTFASL